ncbi:cytochrome b-c1 complex subunit 2, mitochondrial-like [Cydia fagiglandana]|uniref:cytochrome b-c1 complex subunit 2, mitochondrial-like n=1 Tax=Cydia fagiglandana TaxID=1458189 RepID=UPI002FEE106D
MDIHRCTLKNGINLVSTKPHGAPMAACTILYQSGSRFECDDQLGATHFLRTCSSAAGCAYSAFSKTRVLQQLGSYITVNSDRQSIAFTLQCPLPAFHDVKYYLLDIASRTCFRQHEIDLYKPQLKRDLQTVHPEVLVIDLVQKACWGGGLNNSVFCEEERIDSMSSNDLDMFSLLNMRSDTCTMGSYGLPHDEMMTYGEMIEGKRSYETEESAVDNVQMPYEEMALLNRKIDFNLDRPAKPRWYPPSFARGGFEYHDLGPDSDTWIAIAVPGCGNTDLHCLMTHNIVASACGTGNNSSGQHAEDRVPQPPLGGFATDVYTKFRAFNISYADTGVFGILMKTRSCSAASAALFAASFLKKLGKLAPDQICVGRQRLKLDIALQEENCVSISEGMALQAACCGRLDNAYQAISLLNSVTDQEVTATANCLASKFVEYARLTERQITKFRLSCIWSRSISLVKLRPKYAIFHQCFLMTLSRKIIVRKPTLQTPYFFPGNRMAVAVVGDVQAVPHDRELLCAC